VWGVELTGPGFGGTLFPLPSHSVLLASV
jgi:hypothetical protein